MTVRLNLDAVRRRGADYEAAVLARGRVRGRVVEMDDSDFRRLPRPRRKVGLGDLVAQCLGRPGLLFKRTFRRVFGRDCGCAKRQRWLNRFRF